MRGHFFKILSQNPENVKTYCNDINNPIQSACRRWVNKL